VHELDRSAGRDRRRLTRRSRQKDEQWSEPLAARSERLVADRRDEPGMRSDVAREPLLERVEVLLEPRGLADR
jgi:hypothetical protein